MSRTKPELRPYKGLNHVHRKRIQAFENAVRNHEMMGAHHPSDHKAIEEQLDYHREMLVDTILGLYGEKRNLS